jgi:hypothetical protein
LCRATLPPQTRLDRAFSTLPLQALQPPVGTLLLVAVAAQPEAKGHDLSLPPGKKVPDDRR